MAIAIMTSGGDSAGMNPAIKKFVKIVLERGEVPYLIYDGLEGLIDDNIHEATHETVAGIVHLGGTIIRSSRSKRFFEYDYRKQAFDNLQRRGIDKLMVLGGDGSFKALDIFYKDFGVSFIGVPATIDNDIHGTDYCLGVDTALNVIRTAIDGIRDTAASFKRGFVMEIMGRDCGYLTLMSAMTNGAEVMIIPEIKYDLESIKARLKNEIKNGRRYAVALVAEGVKVAQELTEWMQKEVGMESRLTVLGHVQRGGNPTVYDRRMAFEFVAFGMEKLLNDAQCHHVVVYKDADFDFVTIDFINSGKYEISPELIELTRHLSR